MSQSHSPSYYGRPVVKKPAWRSPDVPLYLFLGGLSGASSLVGAGADLRGLRCLARSSRLCAGAGVAASLVALVHDLGRPERFLNMLRVFKPTSPLSMGSWTLASFAPLAGAAAVSELTGRFPAVGRSAGFGAACLGPAMATYTAVLVADTAVPAWHEVHRELPFVFAGSALASAAGAALVLTPLAESVPAARLAGVGVGLELAAMELARWRAGLAAEPYSKGRAGRLVRVATVMNALGVTFALGPRRRSRAGSILAGLSLLGGSLALRFAVFEAGVQSAGDPRYTAIPQRERAGS